MDHVTTGKDVLKKEAEAILKVMEGLDDSFARAAEIIFGCVGRVVLTGMGKSGLVCRKIAATLSSTGTPALFVHPADSFHGDLGMLQRGDALIVVSISGNGRGDQDRALGEAPRHPARRHIGRMARPPSPGSAMWPSS